MARNATAVAAGPSAVPPGASTRLRNGYYAHSLDWLLGHWRETGRITVPADGPMSWTARDDEAEAAAIILAANGGYDGPVTLTAGAAPTFTEIADIASEVTGRTIAPRWSPRTRGSPPASPSACPNPWPG
ncbi:hypothetical protein F8568_037180 [Actinomadura sp. LD22]|uniref:Uncharacterized protein n=1 Tax=Actinomadura physcomitrii TaxID=2650748 RepID=A0A6I4MEU9_9ACTN|nr:hypothetical protein [Actinomadura physcomitrii]MWA04272.1 hypothetical protein [Actinomadura physcomitrii]MWA05893.1 hypothetical protein [Actinomadura physcomitrii]